MNTKHAVLFYPTSTASTHIMWIEGNSFHKEVLPEPCYTLAHLAEVAYTRYITHLWLTPSYGEFEPVSKGDGWSFSPYENRKHQMMGAVVRKQGHKNKDVDIIFPQYTSWWGTDKTPGWIRAADAHEVLITIHYLEQALGVPIGASPGRIGWNYLKLIHPEWIEEVPGIDLKACHFTSAVAPDIIEVRPISDDEQEMLYIHKFDKGGAYPYAGTQTDIGAGTPLHITLPDVAAMHAKHEKGHPQEVGVWLCHVERPESYTDLHGMPVPNIKRGDHWLAGPRIRMLESIGFSIKPLECWVFPERHDTLVKWGNDLWEIRQGFLGAKWVNKKCATFARDATKFLTNATIGLTGFGNFDDGEDMKRPDIRVQVIARHAELMWFNIEKIRVMYGVTPVIVYMDAFFLLSNEPDGRKAFPELVKREGKFGGYKWEGCIPMEKARLVLNARNNESGKLELLNKIGWTL